MGLAQRARRWTSCQKRRCRLALGPAALELELELAPELELEPTRRCPKLQLLLLELHLGPVEEQHRMRLRRGWRPMWWLLLLMAGRTG